MNNPVQNVMVGSTLQPLATEGDNALLRTEIISENQISAVPFKPGK
jgi:hypothetical protein